MTDVISKREGEDRDIRRRAPRYYLEDIFDDFRGEI